MNRIKTYLSDGSNPNGRLFAGDLNALQDAVAALTDLSQALSVGTIAIGESGLQVVRFGAGEARVTGALRVDSFIRGLGGLLAGSFTTAQRDAIASPPATLVVWNSSTLRYEYNAGTSGTPNWQPLHAPTYTSYTPTWGASGTAPVIGNGQFGTRYVQIGKMVHYFGSVQFGTTSTFGTGNYTFTLPVPAAVENPVSMGYIYDSSTGAFGSATVFIITNTTMNLQFGSTYLGALTTVAQTVPWAWASGDQIGWNITYEAA